MNKITYEKMKQAEHDFDFDFFDDLMSYYHDYCDDLNLYDDYVMSSGELEEYIDGLKPYDAFCAGCNADFNWSDDYFYFDGYANIKSCSNALMFFSILVDYSQFVDWYNDNVADEEDEEDE